MANGLQQRLLAQGLMRENRNNPFSDSRFFSGKIRPPAEDLSEDITREQIFKGASIPYAVGATGAMFTPGSGFSDVLGFAPDPMNPGQTLPSFAENVRQGNLLDAGLQTLGAGGDVMLAAAPFAPVLVAPAAAMKGASQLGKALRGGSRVTETSKLFKSVQRFPVLSKSEEALVASSSAPVNEIAGLGRVKIEKIDPNDLEGSKKRFDELKALTSGYKQERAKAKIIRLENGEKAIQYMQPPTEVKKLNISELIATQDNVVLGANKTAGDVMPLVVKKDGKFFIRDGHHRIAQNINSGDKTADVRLIDLDKGGFLGVKASKTVDDVKPGDIAKVEPPTDTQPGIIAFHGSGADFDQFRMDKIGTGEGAQAFGYGLYFTDSEDIAKFYRNSVGGSNVLKRKQGIEIISPLGKEIINANFSGFRNQFSKLYGDDEALFADRYLGQFSIDPDASEEVLVNKTIKLMKSLNEKIPSNTANILKKFKIPDKGKIYKVALAPKPDELLDYDLPLSEQSDFVKSKLQELNIIRPGTNLELIETADYFKKNGIDPTGRELMDFVATTLPAEDFYSPNRTQIVPKKISEKLNSVGIKGIKYLDNFSRNTFGGELLGINKLDDGQFQARIVLDDPNRQTGLGGSGRVITTSKPYKTQKEAEDWANTEIGNRSSNYVIFDENLINILAKYGIVGPVAVTGLAKSASIFKDDENN